MATILDTPQTEAISRLRAAVGVGVAPGDAADARRLLRDLEVEARRLRAVQVELVEEIDRTGLHAVDAHASAKVMARHVCGLSGAEAERRGRAAKALRHLPEVRSAFRAGRIGGCQVDRIARVHANPRVRDALEANEGSFAHQAEVNSYHAFELMVGDCGGGCTCPGNGAPFCGRHNRAKENGHTVHRDGEGTWHTHRPDGTEIE